MRFGLDLPFARNPKSYASFADLNNDCLIGSYVNSSLVNDSANTSSGRSFPVSFLSCTLNSFIASPLLSLIHCVSLTCAATQLLYYIRIFLQIVRPYNYVGCHEFAFWRPEISFVYKYSAISFLHKPCSPWLWYPAPSISFFKNSVSISALATGTTVTFPPFSVVLNPLSTKYSS